MHERLSIVGVGWFPPFLPGLAALYLDLHLLTHVWLSDTGAQPILSTDGTQALAVNGEIYNHKIIRKGLKKPYNFKTHSDCEVIIPLVRKEIFQYYLASRTEDYISTSICYSSIIWC